MSDIENNTVTCFSLREANTIRQKEWDPESKISHSYRGNELAGEMGEALEAVLSWIELAISVGRLSNQIKKYERMELGLVGSITDTSAISKELADVQICLDLVAMNFGVDLVKATKDKFNASSVKHGLKTRYI